MIYATNEKDFYAGGPFPPDRLWTRMDMIGSSNEEAAAIQRGEVAPERVAEIHGAIILAIQHLAAVQPEGRA